MIDYLGTLNASLPKFKVSAVTSGSKLEPTLSIDPPPELLDPEGLGLSETLQQVTEVQIPHDVDLAFVGKWVRSATSALPTDPATEDPIGGMPVVDQPFTPPNPLPSGSVMTSDPGQGTVPGVPEVAGRIRGTIRQTVEKLVDVPTRWPINVAVRWRVLDESTPGGSPPASGVRYRTAPAASWQPLPDPLLLPPGGLPAPGTSLSLSLQFPAMFSELTSGVPDVMTFSVRASIRLSVDPAPAPAVQTGWFDLPPVPLVVPTIPVPTILVLCEDRNFAGRKLVLVPTGSLLGAASGAGGVDIGTALNLTSSALQALGVANQFGGFLAGSAGGNAAVAATVLRSLASSPRQITIAAHSHVDDLSAPDFVIDPGGMFGIGRLTGDNMARSIICIGRPGTVFTFDQDLNLRQRITWLQVTLDERLGCAIQKLDLLDPSPDAVYGGDDAPFTSRVTSSSPQWSYEDRTTSLEFVGPPARFVRA